MTCPIIVEQDRILVKRLRNYRQESDREFHKLAKKLGNERHCYFELLESGAYTLVPKRDIE